MNLVTRSNKSLAVNMTSNANANEKHIKIDLPCDVGRAKLVTVEQPLRNYGCFQVSYDMLTARRVRLYKKRIFPKV
jgi:hypothetical protein